MSSLDLGVIGNCSFGALIDSIGRMVWCCLPRFDADPVFCSLLNGDESENGVFAIDLHGRTRSEQFYKRNTAILVTRLFDDGGNAIEITDFAPRFRMHGRRFRPTMLIRSIVPIAGTPRICIRIRPRFDYGAMAPTLTHGSNHIRYVGEELTLRLTTNAPISYLLSETSFCLEEPLSLIFGPDETLAGAVEATAREFQERTAEYWRLWVRSLALPFEWQEAVIRAAITLKLCEFEETGAIVAAMTTSVPEAPGTERNWDYRFCWLRDAFFVVRALNGLAEVETMESYLRYLHNIIAANRDGNTNGHMQPVYGIGLERRLEERIVPSLSGYRGMGPVRVGNQAHEHIQHDVYGNAILAGAQAFFDKRLLSQTDDADFERFETVGERAFQVYDQPDAGMWELRSRSSVHTSSSLMCWAACDRLAKIAAFRGLDDRARIWQARADKVHATILEHAWNDEIGAFAESFGGKALDASLLLMAEVGFLEPDDPRFRATLERIESNLRHGNHLYRYNSPDDFGVPQTAFNICTFWYIDSLARIGRTTEARDIFESMLACRNRLGLFSEDIDPDTGEHWGNYPQTYSLVGIINCAIRLSQSWQSRL